MAKAAITKKYALSASGILAIAEDGVYIENTENGEAIDFRDLLSDFADKSVKLSINYDEDYGTDAE
jgi:hypothetical protein